MTDAMFTHMFGSSPDADDPIGYLLQQCYEGAITEDALNAAAKQHREATDQRKRDRDAVARIITLDHLQLLHDFDVDGDLYRLNPECRDGAYVTADAILAILDADAPPAPVPAPAAEPVRIADALEACDWSGCSIGNKMLLRAAVQCLRASPPPSAAPTDNMALEEAATETVRLWENSEGLAVMGSLHRLRAALASRPAAPTDNTALEAAAKDALEELCRIDCEGITETRNESDVLERVRFFASRGAANLRAALASRPAAPAEGDVGAWREIETAPNEELVYVLGRHEDGSPWWNLGSRWGDEWDGGWCGAFLPTHWMPLPEAPRPQSSAQGGEG